MVPKMDKKIPNHICKNSKCDKGANGSPQHYWACNDCEKRKSWKAAACSEECYTAYMNEISISRGKKTAEVDGQISIFDVVPEPVVPEPDTTVEPTPIIEPKKDSNTTFMGYYNKKNKHR